LRWCDPTNRCMIYVYDLAGGWWTEFRGISASYLLALPGVEEADGLLSGDWQGRVYRQDTGDTDDGKPIVSSWKSKVFTLVPGIAMQYRRVSVEIQRMQGPMHVDWFTRSGARTGTITLEPAPTGTVWGSSYGDRPNGVQTGPRFAGHRFHAVRWGRLCSWGFDSMGAAFGLT